MSARPPIYTRTDTPVPYTSLFRSGAVAGGQVKSAAEYADMTEFAASVSARLATLPPTPERAKLIEGATRLQAVVAAKGRPSQVADLAHGLPGDLLKAYPVPLPPARVPDFARGETRFVANCASFHGAAGKGNRKRSGRGQGGAVREEN